MVMFEKEGGATLEVPCPYAARPGALTRIVTDFAGFGAAGGGDDDGGGGGAYLMDGDDDDVMLGGGGGIAPLLPVVLDCQVEEGGAPGLGPWPMSRLRASRGGRLLWREVVPGRAVTLCGNGTVVAVGCMVRRFITTPRCRVVVSVSVRRRTGEGGGASSVPNERTAS